jgi:GNAT superfamily N-acetyltransferase
MIGIRKATVSDAQQLVFLLQGIGWFDSFDGGSVDALTSQVQARLEQCLADDSHLVLVAEDADGKIAAYSSVHWLPYLFMAGPEGYVSELFVSVTARGRGVGRELLKTVESAARARGCQRLSLTNLRNRESYQRQFYTKAGWRERSEAANFIYPLS